MSSKILPLIFRSVAVFLYFDLLCCNVSSKESGREIIQPFTIYPYVVLVKLKVKNSYCTGILMTSDWVLTAAHCTYQETDTSIRVFTLAKSASENKADAHIKINVKYNISSDFQYRDSLNFHIPWGWKYAVGDFFGKSDLAIIQLKSEFNDTSFDNIDAYYYHLLPMSAKQTCQAVGFTFEAEDETIMIERDIIVQKQCTDNPIILEDKELRFLSWFCQADENIIEDVFSMTGALLFCKNETKPVLVGVGAGKFKPLNNSTSDKKLAAFAPMVFTDICPYLTWIHSYVGNNFPLSPGNNGYDCFFASSSPAKEKIPFSMCFFIYIGISLNIINIIFKF